MSKPAPPKSGDKVIMAFDSVPNKHGADTLLAALKAQREKDLEKNRVAELAKLIAKKKDEPDKA